MKKQIGISFLAIALSGPCIAPLLPVSVAQDRDRRDDDDRPYMNNRYYKQGWKDGEHHKHRKHKWKNEDDRRAYEAGYAHGDRGDRYPKRDRDDRR